MNPHFQNKRRNLKVFYRILIADKDNTENVIYYSIKKSRPDVRSILGAGTLGLVNAFDLVMLIKHDLNQMIGNNLKMKLLTYRKTLSYFAAWNSSQIEMILLIDVKAVIEAYNDVIIDGITRCRINSNL